MRDQSAQGARGASERAGGRPAGPPGSGPDWDGLRDEHAALAQVRRFLLVGFRERQRAPRPASPVQEFPLPVDLH
jgi:hypothetical protein